MLLGKLSTLYFSGFSPDTGMVYKKGELGRTPKIAGPLIRGAFFAFGVNINLPSPYSGLYILGFLDEHATSKKVRINPIIESVFFII